MTRYQGDQLLMAALREPTTMAGLELPEWEVLIQAARQTRLLARLYFLARQAEITEQLPAAVQQQLTSAVTVVAYHQRRANWELNRIQRVLYRNGIAMIALKGSAYLQLGLKLGQGREMRDVDLMIQRGLIDKAEKLLLDHGWGSVKLDGYDQQYYRKWMHELPPLRHIHRVTEVDMHHTILPLTSRLKPDANALLDAAIQLRPSGLYVLAPTDMLLHSAVHLFFDGAMDQDLRDVVDLDWLLRHFSADPSFWDELVPRAESLQLGRPLFYALRFSQRLLDTPIPAAVMEQSRQFGPGPITLRIMDALIPRALLPSDSDRRTYLTAIARWLLYLRSHWLRMPPLMLARHLFHKGVISHIRGRNQIFE